MKIIITNLRDADLLFNNKESATKFADKYNLNVSEIYYLDEHQPRFLGYGITDDEGNLEKNFTWV